MNLRYFNYITTMLCLSTFWVPINQTTLSVFKSWLEDGPEWLSNLLRADLRNTTS